MKYIKKNNMSGENTTVFSPYVFISLLRMLMIGMWLFAIYFDVRYAFDSNVMWIESTLHWNQKHIEFKYELDIFVKNVSIHMNKIKNGSTIYAVAYIVEIIKYLCASY